jgi:O-antigen ligase
MIWYDRRHRVSLVACVCFLGAESRLLGAISFCLSFFFWFFCLFSVMSYFSEWLSLLETTSRVFVETFVFLFRSFFHFPLNFGRIETTVVFGAAYQLPFSHGKPFNHLSF